MPVASVLSLQPESSKFIQEISIIPTTSSNLEYAMEAVLKGALYIKQKIATSEIPHTCLTDSGCPRTTIANAEQALRVRTSVVS